MTDTGAGAREGVSNSRLFCIGFIVFGTLHVVSVDLGWVSALALSDYWTAKLCVSALGGALLVALLGDRRTNRQPDGGNGS